MLYQLSYHGGYPSSILYGIYVHLYMEESVSAACYHYGECGTPFFAYWQLHYDCNYVTITSNIPILLWQHYASVSSQKIC